MVAFAFSLCSVFLRKKKIMRLHSLDITITFQILCSLYIYKEIFMRSVTTLLLNTRRDSESKRREMEIKRIKKTQLNLIFFSNFIIFASHYLHLRITINQKKRTFFHSKSIAIKPINASWSHIVGWLCYAIDSSTSCGTEFVKKQTRKKNTRIRSRVVWPSKLKIDVVLIVGEVIDRGIDDIDHTNDRWCWIGL